LTYGAGTGGGIHNTLSNPVVYNCVFESNTASEGGGGMYNNASAPSITNTIFMENNAGAGLKDLILLQGANGGGVSGAAPGGGGTAVGILSYVAGSGGALRNDNSEPSVMNCTFAGNTAVDGGAMYNEDAAVDVTNSILWNDGPNEIAGKPGSVATVTYSDVQGGYSGEGNIDSDPFFYDILGGDFRLFLGSPCIDTGTADGAPPDDIWGVPRPQGEGIDMGVHER